MASDKIIHGRINVDAINKAWLFKGEKGTYLDFTMFYNEEQDQYQTNGMIVQSVPSAIFKKEKDLPKEQRSKGEILGNCKEFSKLGSRAESTPGYTGKASEEKKSAAPESAPATTDVDEDDLPF